jgi:signal peptidase I
MDWKLLLGHRIVKLVSIGGFIASAFMVQPYRPMIFVGKSMTPTYQNREFALSTTNTSNLKKGDVVVIEAGKGTIVKRVAFLPGDWIQYYKFKTGWAFVDQKVISQMRNPERFPLRHERIPEGYVFVLGDNPTVSVDSRQFGILPIASIKAKLVDPKPLPH